MLVLSRKAREQIQIGDEVVVTILQVKGQTVRIGIEAPRNVRVLRAELPKHETLGDMVSEDKAEQMSAKTLARGSRTQTRVAHPGEQAAVELPPLAGKLDARRRPQLSSLEPTRHSRPIETSRVWCQM